MGKISVLQFYDPELINTTKCKKKELAKEIICWYVYFYINYKNLKFI